jgi:CubicO group peptidase (beta-lactamase class C family)
MALTGLITATLLSSSLSYSWDGFFTHDDGHSGFRTDAVLIQQNGQMLYERYDREFNSQKKHILWSISKTITSLLYAVLEYENKIQRDDSICKYLKVKDPSHCKIKLRHLLDWTSGLRWVEEYEKSKRPRKASILAMLYGEGHKDMVSFVLGHPLEFEPGSAWRYSSGDTILLMRILQNLFPEKDIRQVFLEKLFLPLGINDFTLQEDHVGTAGGAYFFYMRAPDLLKLGELILKRGRLQKKQLFAAEWINFMAQVPLAFKNQRIEHDGKNIGGGHIWVNNEIQAGINERPWPSLPQDSMMAMGHWGQYLVIVPSLKLVALKFGDCRDGSLNAKKFTEILIDGLKVK